MKAITITTVPSDVGSVFPGKAGAPDALLATGLVKKLQALSIDVEVQNVFRDKPIVWASSSPLPNGARNEDAAVAVCKSVKNSITKALSSSATPSFQIILGGECLICPAIMSALAYHMPEKRIGLLYVDADCDLTHPHEPNSSGNIASMTFTHLTLRHGALESMKEFCRPDGSGVVNSSNAVLFGLNASSSANKRDHLGYLLDNHYRVITSAAVSKNALTRAEEALRWLEERVDCILVHLDVDVIDPGLFPLGNIPNYTGIGFTEIMNAMRIFLSSSKAVGLTIAEVNPDHDRGLRMTTELVDEIVSALKQRAQVG